jgi:hypothetical protein
LVHRIGVEVNTPAAALGWGTQHAGTLDFARVGSLERSVKSTCTDRGAQVLPPAGATVPPWLPAKSAHVSNLPACCALGPLASAAQYSCRHEPCTGRSAWPHLARLACPLGSSTAAGSSFRHNQGLKAGPHALASAPAARPALSSWRHRRVAAAAGLPLRGKRFWCQRAPLHRFDSLPHCQYYLGGVRPGEPS